MFLFIHPKNICCALEVCNLEKRFCLRLIIYKQYIIVERFLFGFELSSVLFVKMYEKFIEKLTRTSVYFA